MNEHRLVLRKKQTGGLTKANRTLVSITNEIVRVALRVDSSKPAPDKRTGRVIDSTREVPIHKLGSEGRAEGLTEEN